MIKLLNILSEIADSPYPLTPPSYRKVTKWDNYVDYNFTTDTGRKYYVRFSNTWKGGDKEPDQKYNWYTELTFSFTELASTPDTEVGTENFGKILATVGEALKKYTSTYKPEYIAWRGIIGHKEEKAGISKRHRVYNMFLDREGKNIKGYTLIKGDHTSGLMTNSKIPVPGASEIFTYPEPPSIYDKLKSQAKISRFNLSR